MISTGQMHEAYLGDTVIDGRTAQRIHRNGSIIYSSWINQDTVEVVQDVFTSQTDGDVFLWVDHGDAWSWDTLFRFHAVPGDSWTATCIMWIGAGCVATVMDTATVQVDGLSLRQLRISIHPEDYEPSDWTSTVTERLGFEYGNWNMSDHCVTDGDIYSLLCYADEDIMTPGTGWGAGCSPTTRVPTLLSALPPPYPNPGTTHFTLELPPGPHTITLFDATGREVLQQRSSGGRTMVGTEELVPGLYTVRCIDAQGRGGHSTWVRP